MPSRGRLLSGIGVNAQRTAAGPLDLTPAPAARLVELGQEQVRFGSWRKATTVVIIRAQVQMIRTPAPPRVAALLTSLLPPTRRADRTIFYMPRPGPPAFA